METGGMEGTRRGFVGSLFDLSFRHLVTGRVVSVLYVVSVVFVSLYALFLAGYFSALLGVFLGATTSDAFGWVVGVILYLVLAPVFLFIGVVYVRVTLEIVTVLFRIAENTAAIAERMAPERQTARIEG